MVYIIYIILYLIIQYYIIIMCERRFCYFQVYSNSEFSVAPVLNPYHHTEEVGVWNTRRAGSHAIVEIICQV